MSQSGVTLMELVVVLAILAMLAGVAVRGLGEAGMRGRVEATRRTLEVVREGVLGVEERSGGGGGFLADMGRLPRLGEWTDGDGAGWLGFRDLVDGPGMAAHGMYPALGSNVVARFVGEWDGTNASVVASEAVWVKAGWRGPYVVGRGADGMPLDGWGRLMAARPGGGGPCWMLIWQTNGLPLSGTAPWPIGHGIASGVGLPLSGVVCDAGAEAGGGSGAVREWVTWGRHDVIADPVVVQVRDVAGRWASGGVLLVMWYGPNPEMGADGRPVQAMVRQVTVSGGGGVAVVSWTGESAPTHGPRVFRACLRVGGDLYDTGPLHVLVGRGTSLVELRLP